MDCQTWQKQIDDLISGRLSPRKQQLAQEHAAACDDCRRLLATVLKSRRVLSEAERHDLTDAILARTTGSACGRAQEMLGDLVSQRLTTADAHLVRQHLDRCGECAALAVTLTWLMPELAEMAHLEPDAQFVRDVMRRTAHAPRKVSHWLGRLESWWRRQLARPQFSLEAAYVGTVLLILLCGTPVSPLKQVPQKALAAVENGPTVVTSAVAQPLQELPAEASRLGKAAWDATGGHVVSLVSGGWDRLSDRHERAEPALRQFQQHGNGCFEELFDGDFVGAVSRLNDMRSDLKRAWESWKSQPRTGNPESEQPESGPSHGNESSGTGS